MSGVRMAAVFPAGRGVARWAERNAASPVPSRWPYGLEQLAGPDVELVDVEVPPPGRIERRALSYGLPSRLRGAPVADVALCWDEGTAVAMSARVAAGRRLSGVIWATDALQAGERTGELRTARAALRRLDALWVLSEPQIAEVAAWLGTGHPPIHFLPFGVDTDFYRATPYPDRPLIVSIGGDRDRDAATLYAALAQVLARRPDVECVVQSTSALPVPDGVTRHEFIPHDEVRRLYARASVVPIATRPNWHASGMTVALEAASCARPVVACDTPGMRDYVQPGVTGELVSPGDADALAARVLEFLADQDRAREFGAAGRELVDRTRSTVTMCAALRGIAGVPVQAR